MAKIGIQTIQYKPEGDLAHEYNPLHNIIDKKNDKATVIDYNESLDEIKDFTVPVSELGVDLNNPVDIECQPSYDGSVNLIINDDKNPPRIINTRYSIIEDNRYKIINRNQVNQTNLYDLNNIDEETRLFRNIRTIPNIQLKAVNYYGQLKAGNYIFYIKLADNDYNKTDIVAESGSIPIFHGTLTNISTISGALAEELTDKSIELELYNIDTTFSKLYLYYTRTTSDINGIRYSKTYEVIQPYDIVDSKVTISFNGFENVNEIDEEQLNIKYNLVTAVKTQAQVQNMLFFGNTNGIQLNHRDLQAISYYIEATCAQSDESKYQVGYVDNTYTQLSTNGVTQNEYYNPLNVYYYLGYWPTEIYRFGIVYIMNDDSLSPVYNLRGIKFTELGDTNINTKGKYGNLMVNTGNENEKVLNYLPLDLFIGESNLTNTKGIFQMPNISIIDNKTVKPLYLKFTISSEVKQKLSEYQIKGYFFVRQKRIPTILAQGLSIGIAAIGYVPLIYTDLNDNETEEKYETESFLSQNSGILSTTFKDRIIYVERKGSSALLCLDANVNPLLQSNFNGMEYVISKSKNGKINRSDRMYNWTENEAENKTFDVANYYKAKLLYVGDDIPLKFIDQKGFSTRAGSAEDVSQFSFIESKTYTGDNRKLVRGNYCPFLATNGQLDDNCIYNIRISNYSSVFIEQYFSIRANDQSSYYAVSDRYQLNLDSIDSSSDSDIISVYRGDCFTNTVTLRLQRNFIDSDAPVTEMILDPNTWRDHYTGTTSMSKESWGDINRADVNTVPIGSWITFKVLSNYNLGLRSEDSTHTEEAALMGNNRSFYPLKSTNTFSSGKIPESFILNEGYNTSLSAKRYQIVPDVPYIKELFDTRIMFSNVQVEDSFQNAYRIFQGLSYKDLDRQYGAIVKLLPWGVNLFCVFEHGLGIIPINEKALISTNTGQSIHMYGAGVIQNQITLISPDFGSTWKESIVRTPLGVYGVDAYAKKIWRFSENKGLELLSDFKVQRFLNDNIDLKESEKYPIIGARNIKTHFNMYKGDIIFTFYNSNKTWSLCYNERLDKWITRYTWTPLYSANINNIFYSLDRDRAKLIGTVYASSQTLGINLTNAIWKKKESSWTDFETTLNYNSKLFTRYRYRINSITTYSVPNNTDEPYPKIIWKYDYQNISDTVPIELTEIFGNNVVKYDKTYNGYVLSADDNNITKLKIQLSAMQEQTSSGSKRFKYFDLVFNVTVFPIVNSESNEFDVWGSTVTQNVAVIIDRSELESIEQDDYDRFLSNYFFVHGRAGIFDDINYFDEDLDNQISPTKWYNRQHPFEFEFVVNNLTGLHKIFNNLVIISNNAEPESFEFEIIGDTYDFNKVGIYKADTFANSIADKNNYIWGDDNPWRPIRDTNKSYKRSQNFNIYNQDVQWNVKVNWDPILNQYSLIVPQEAKNIVKYGRVKGNIQYREDSWHLVIKPILYKEDIKLQDKVPTENNTIQSTRIRDKFLKVRVKYSGKQLAIITGLKTLMTLSYS